MAIASTLRKNYQSIPSAALLAQIGNRVRNAKVYESTRRRRSEIEGPAILPATAADRSRSLLSDDNFVEVEIEP